MQAQSQTKMQTKSGVYEIFNLIDGKRYIGQSQYMKKRWTAHKWHLRNGQHQSPYLQRAWDKHGEGAFKFRVILTCAVSMLDFYEQQLLDRAKPEYNTCPIAESCRGVKRLPEFGEAISKRMMGNTILKGKKLPADWCAAISAGLKGGKRTEAQKVTLSEAHMGVRRSPESRVKQSKTMMGQKKTAEHAANISKAKKGVKTGPQSPELIAARMAGMRAGRARRAAEQAAL